MAQADVHNNMPEVFVTDDSLFIANLVETDRDVLTFVASAPDPSDAVKQSLQVGARCLSAASPIASTLDVQKQFDELESKFNSKVDEAVDEVEAVTKQLLDSDEGALVQALQAHQEGLDDALGEHFDAESKSSLYSIIEKTLADALSAQNEKFRRTVSMDSPDSPLRVMKKDILEGVEKPISELQKQVQEISEKVAVDQAVATVTEITSKKGFDFEDVLHAELEKLAEPHGDLAEQTGNTIGAAGTKKGDEVVHLNTDDTHGVDACFTLEAKTKKLTTPEAHRELDAALENRSAAAAILVFDSLEKAPTSVPFQHRGNKAIVSLTGEDTSSLKLAYMWARWMTRRACEPAGSDSIDLDRIGEILDKIGRAINRRTQIKSNHTKACRAVNSAQDIVSEMTTDIEELLAELSEELS